MGGARTVLWPEGGPGVRRPRGPGLEEVRGRLLPQLVPYWLVPEEYRGDRDLAAIPHLGEVAVAFVVDEPHRYTYIDYAMLGHWNMAKADLLALALANLARSYRPATRRGAGHHLALVWQARDGYDAARLLLTRRLCEAAALVPGNPVIAAPHRDLLIMFGDADPVFVAEMAEFVDVAFNHSPYPVSPQLYTLREGTLQLYRPAGGHPRMLH